VPLNAISTSVKKDTFDAPLSCPAFLGHQLNIANCVSMGDDKPSAKSHHASFLAQLRASVSRIQIKKRRRRSITISEIAVPLLPLLVLLILRYTLPTTGFEENYLELGNSSVWSSEALSFNIRNQPESRVFQSLVIFAAPGSSEKAIESVFRLAVAVKMNAVKWFHPPLDLKIITDPVDEEHFRANEGKYFAAINVIQTEPNLTYQVHTRATPRRLSVPALVFNATRPISQCRDQYGDSRSHLLSPLGCDAVLYYHTGFVSLTALIDLSWMSLHVEDFEVPNVLVKLAPKEAFERSRSDFILRSLPAVIVISLTLYIPYITASVVEEKERKVRQLLRLSGLYDSAYWLSWVVSSGLMVSVISLAGSVIVHFIPPEKNLITLVYKFLMFSEYELSMIMFGLMLASFFKNSRVAVFFGLVAATVLIALCLTDEILENNYASVFLSALFSTCAFWRGLNLILASESVTEENEARLMLFLALIAIDSVIYLLLAVYLDQVVPVGYGANRQVWYPFQREFYSKSTPYKEEIEPLQSSETLEAIHPADQNAIAIKVRHLRKAYLRLGGGQRVALDDFSVDICAGEITGIVGHARAGKTVLLHTLIGMEQIDSGTVQVFGYDIQDQNQMDAIRRTTGFCPQANVLFQDLTIRQHITFFGLVRGIAAVQVGEEVEDVMRNLHLADHADEIAHKLSPRLKRLLCVANALIGKPKLIVLDEPSAGLDAVTRRFIWRTLRSLCPNRVIIVSSHQFGDIDVLTRRKVVLTEGNVRCWGLSPFLKELVGINDRMGYHMMVETSSEGEEPLAHMTRAISRIVKGAYLEDKTQDGRHHLFLLPKSETASFGELFAYLEDNSKAKRDRTTGGLGGFHIVKYSVRSSSFDEIFLHMGREAEGDKKIELKNYGVKLIKQQFSRITSDEKKFEANRGGLYGQMTTNDPDVNVIEAREIEYDRGNIFLQLLAVRLRKRYREPLWHVFLFGIPILMVLAGSLLIGRMAELPPDDIRTRISLKLYEDVVLGFQDGCPNATQLRIRPPCTQCQACNALVQTLRHMKELRILEHKPRATFAQYLSEEKESQTQIGVVKFTATASQQEIVLYLNDSYLHSLPILTNLVSNLWLERYPHLSNSSILCSSIPYVQEEEPKVIRSSMFGERKRQFHHCLCFSISGGIIVIALAMYVIPTGLAFDIVDDRLVWKESSFIHSHRCFPREGSRIC